MRQSVAAGSLEPFPELCYGEMMTLIATKHPVPETPWLDWLLRLRMLTGIGMGLTLAFTASALQLDIGSVPLVGAFITFFFSSLIFSRLSLTVRRRPDSVGAIIVFDLLLLTFILHFSGGPENPFSILYLLSVILAAVFLERGGALAVALLAISLYALLFLHQPASMHHHGHGSLGPHLFGMWLAFSLVALVSALCVGRITAELRQKEREAEALQIRQKQLASLTTLAAGAAHELSTPLGTMAIVLGELRRGFMSGDTAPENASVAADLQLLESELARCKEIITRMSGCSGEVPGENQERFSFANLEQLLRTHLERRFGSSVEFRVNGGFTGGALIPRRALTEAIGALAKNSVEASPGSSTVKLELSASPDHCCVAISDEGTGIVEGDLARFGEPFFTTKPHGMGLGVFLARLTAESIGGSLSYRSQPGRGTTAFLQFPLRYTP